MLALVRCSPTAADVGRRGAGTDPAPRWSAHDRLLRGVSELAAREGFAQLTVERVLAAAGASRSSFYQYFRNVEDCFWSAYREHSECLADAVAIAVAHGGDRDLSMLDALVDAAICEPDIARLLMTEGLAGGPVGLAERDTLIARIERAVGSSGQRRSTIDIPGAILIGGIFRFLSMRLADGNALDGLHEEVREWAAAFIRRSGEPSWSDRFPPGLPQRPWRSTPPTPAVGSHASARERILRATAAVIAQKGYRRMTVADIVALAGVSRRLFYTEFASKPAAFIAAYEHMFQRTIAICTPAFFSPGGWPERVWQSGCAFSNFLTCEPLLAYLGFVECYAIGPGFVPRVHDTQLAFTLFLEEGFRQGPQAQSLSRACASLSQATIFESGFQACRCGVGLYARRVQPLGVYVALAPFIGADAAGEFVTGKLCEWRASVAAA